MQRIEVHRTNSNPRCLNPQIVSGKFADSEVDSSQFELASANVMQRHCDRWLYEHWVIQNKCWPDQKNSSRASSPLAAAECDFGSRHLGTVWQTWDTDHTDPFAAPRHGTCQVSYGTPQGTQQGAEHARHLGAMFRTQYVESGLVPESCPKEAIGLQAYHVHKNELALQAEYEAMCGRPPSVEDYPPESTIVDYVWGHQKGSPWYLDMGQCGNPRLDELQKEGLAKMHESPWWNEDVLAVALEAAAVSSHEVRSRNKAGELLSAMVDCVVVHACTGLGDVPSTFVDSEELPNMAPDALFTRMDKNETARLTWNFNYFRSKSPEAYREYAALYYGYSYAVLRDRLLAAAKGDPRAPKLEISVMSDKNIIPQLAMYGLSYSAEHRPPYLSALVHEVYREKATGELFVRVIYNGNVKRVCSGNNSFPLCPWKEWDEVVSKVIPSFMECPPLYEAYEFMARCHGGYKGWMSSELPLLATHFILGGLIAAVLVVIYTRLGCPGCKRRNNMLLQAMLGQDGTESSTPYVNIS